jgi:hypothetical protein
MTSSPARSSVKTTSRGRGRSTVRCVLANTQRRTAGTSSLANLNHLTISEKILQGPQHSSKWAPTTTEGMSATRATTGTTAITRDIARVSTRSTGYLEWTPSHPSTRAGAKK